MQRPWFGDLSTAQQRQFGNGVGPYWMSDTARGGITRTASWFFSSASWRHHDFGYCVGGDRWDRARCDWKFLRAMLKDACSLEFAIAPIATPISIVVSIVFYVAVRFGGQWGSFKYRDGYATLEEVLEISRQ